MRSVLRLGIVVACLAGAVRTPVMADTPASPPADQTCREYTAPIIFEGRPRTVLGHACLRPDGSWRLQEDAAIPAPPKSFCQERISLCDRSCDDHGILGAIHTHPDCSTTCDRICGMREGYAPWLPSPGVRQ